MQSPRLLPLQQAKKALKWPLLLGALLLPYLFYDVFPNMGVSQFSNLFELERSFTVLAMLIAGIFYVKYLGYIKNNPLIIVIFLTSFAVIGEALNNALLDYTPINIKYRVMLFLTVVMPSLYFLFQYFPAFNRTLPYLKYFFAYVVMLFIYFFFYNVGMTDPKRAVDSIIGDGSFSWGQINSTYIIFSGIVVSAFALIKSKNLVATFDKINLYFLSTTAAASLYTLVGYPLQLTSHTVDGFLRARGLLAHANPFAHHMSVILIYQLGIYFYYQFSKEKRMPPWLMLLAFALNIVAFLLALSKTAIATTLICAFVFLLLNIGSPRFRMPLLRTLMALVLLMPVGFISYEIATGKSIFSVVEARMEETTSLTWRNEIWDALKADAMDTPIFGHGFTASNQRIFQLYYDTSKNKSPLILVHNGYVGLFYDFGLLGYLLFVAAASLIWTGARLWYLHEEYRPLSSTVICLGVYFLVVCNFDEMVYMFDAPNLIWAFSTLLITLVLYLTRQPRLNSLTPTPVGGGVITSVEQG